MGAAGDSFAHFLPLLDALLRSGKLYRSSKEREQSAKLSEWNADLLC